jgi:hypothetical protein
MTEIEKLEAPGGRTSQCRKSTTRLKAMLEAYNKSTPKDRPRAVQEVIRQLDQMEQYKLNGIAGRGE